MIVRRIPLIALLLASSASALAQADQAVVTRIVDEGKNHNQVMEHEKYLTQKIGHRLTASPQLDQAYAWTMKKFKEFGCKNVHLEPWGEWPVGFDRGRRQIGRMVSPDKMDFEFTTASWMPGTKGLVRGPAIYAPTTTEELDKVKDKLKGAWVLYKTNPPRRFGATAGAPQQSDVENALDAAGIAGRIIGSSNDLVLTGGNWRIEWDKLPTQIRITIGKKYKDAIMERLDAGKDVQLEFDMDNKFVKGPRKNCNVIAEIPGTEKPDEVVIVSGHLDGWDGPQSEDAQDNGTGTCVTLEAARILCKAGAKPKRTIRFILWTGEEQGLFGSQAYVKEHSSEMDRISCVFVDDGGTGYEGGLACTKEMEPILTEALAPAMKAFPEMPMRVTTVERIRGGGGSDHASFNAVGVPGFFWFESGEKQNYNRVHHTQYDRIDTVVPEYIVQSSMNSAAASYIVACAPTLLPRPPKQAPSSPITQQ